MHRSIDTDINAILGEAGDRLLEQMERHKEEEMRLLRLAGAGHMEVEPQRSSSAGMVSDFAAADFGGDYAAGPSAMDFVLTGHSNEQGGGQQQHRMQQQRQQQPQQQQLAAPFFGRPQQPRPRLQQPQQRQAMTLAVPPPHAGSTRTHMQMQAPPPDYGQVNKRRKTSQTQGQAHVPALDSAALNKDCAVHLAKKVVNDLGVLMQFVQAVDTRSQFSQSEQHLEESKRAMQRFMHSLLPTFCDLPPAVDLSRATLAEFNMQGILGTGTFGQVRLCKYGNDYLCAKILSKETVVRLKQQGHVNSEKNILLQCNHPFIVKLFKTYQDERNLYLIMEYVTGGELFTAIRKSNGLNPSHVRIYAAEIILVIEYLHHNNIVHRDLKPENLLIDRYGHLKLTDFGFAKLVRDKTWTMCGTPEYIAPEIILSKGHGKGVDWWSLGVLIFEMLAGYPPFQGDSNFTVFQKILGGEVVMHSSFDPVAADLISKLLVIDITKRLGCMRGGAADVKQHPWFAGLDWDALYHKRMTGPLCPSVAASGDTSNYHDDGGGARSPRPFTGDQDLFKDF